MLSKNKLLKVDVSKKYYIFGATSRPSRRIFNNNFSLSGLATGPRSSTAGLFYFGYLSDSGANDPHLCLTHERVLEEAVGDSGFKGALRVARKLPGVENWLHDSVDVFDSFPTVCFGLFYK